MTKTRGVFALITEGKRLLLSERMDGKGWNLPGGRVEGGETDQVVLVREVKEETGLDVEVLHQVGPDHVFNDDTALAYACKVIGGQLTVTAEAKNHAYVNAQEVRQGYYLEPSKEDDPNTGLRAQKPLKLVGPEGRLGRTGRMVWDAFSLMGMSDRYVGNLSESHLPGAPDFPKDLPIGKIICQGPYLFQRQNEEVLDCWRRLDPYSPTGQMPTK